MTRNKTKYIFKNEKWRIWINVFLGFSGEDLNENNIEIENNDLNINQNNELEEKNEEISSLKSEQDFYKEKNEELNQELEMLKSLLIDNNILNNEISTVN